MQKLSNLGKNHKDHLITSEDHLNTFEDHLNTSEDF